jgi:uncharacterized protein (DUF2132 family)
MSEIREAVLEEVMQRLVEEYGVEILALDWNILNEVVEDKQKDYNDE